MKPERITAATITQRELREFLDLKDQLSALKRRFEQERDRLRQLVENKAPVEPGLFEINVKEFTQQRVTWAFLVGVLGEEGYESMRSEAPPTVYRRLVVRKKVHQWMSFVREDRP